MKLTSTPKIAPVSRSNSNRATTRHNFASRGNPQRGTIKMTPRAFVGRGGLAKSSPNLPALAAARLAKCHPDSGVAYSCRPPVGLGVRMDFLISPFALFRVHRPHPLDMISECGAKICFFEPFGDSLGKYFHRGAFQPRFSFLASVKVPNRRFPWLQKRRHRNL